MDMKRHFLYFLCLSMIAALALAGCNGDGGKKMMPPLPTPAMTERAEDISDAIEGITGITGIIPSSTSLPAGNGFPDNVSVDREVEGDPIFTLEDEKRGEYEEFTDSEDNPEYKKAMGVTTPEIDGWYGETLTRSTDTTGTDLVTLYTDIENATELKVTSSTNLSIDISKSSRRVILGGVGPIDLMHDNTDTFIGKFGGEDGTFTCTATGGCAVVLATGSTNIAESISGTWSFESTEPVQDKDYLVFGYWLNERTNNRFSFNPIFNGYNWYDAGPFGDLVDSDTLSVADSKATYTGAAAGRYVEKTIRLLDNDVLDTEYATEGQFTADASFTAYFGENENIDFDLQNTITGGITNFKDADENDLEFEIDLGPVDLVDAYNDSLASQYILYESKNIEASHGETPSNGGSWSFAFYGTSEDLEGKTILPSGIAGAFQANFNNGNVAGAFGATKED